MFLALLAVKTSNGFQTHQLKAYQSVSNYLIISFPENSEGIRTKQNHEKVNVEMFNLNILTYIKKIQFRLSIYHNNINCFFNHSLL